MPAPPKTSFWVYIVRGRDGRLYTGYTNNLPRRIREHNTGPRGAKALRGVKPVHLVYTREYRDIRCALKEERRIKRLPKKDKETLVCRKDARLIRSNGRHLTDGSKNKRRRGL